MENVDSDPNQIINDNLINYYLSRIQKENKNIQRIKKLYNDDDSFNHLMNQIIEKDVKRFESLVAGKKNYPDPWKILYTILEIVQEEGKEIRPFDTLTKMLPSYSLLYHGWVFSWVHGEGTLISIYNRENELIYQL